MLLAKRTKRGKVFKGLKIPGNSELHGKTPGFPFVDKIYSPYTLFIQDYRVDLFPWKGLFLIAEKPSLCLTSRQDN